LENDFNVDLKEAAKHRKQLPSTMLGALSKREEELLKEDEAPKVCDSDTICRSGRESLIATARRIPSSNGTRSSTASTKRRPPTFPSSARSYLRQSSSLKRTAR